MKSKIVSMILIGLVITSCSKMSLLGNARSFSDQLCELVQKRDSGIISEREYHSLKQRITSVMLH